MKYAVVTGASSGIGLETARLLALSGYSLVLVARRRERLEQLAELLPTPSRLVCLDLAAPDGAAALARASCDLDVEVLINNAGMGRIAEHVEMPPERARAMAHLNVTCLTELCSHFGKRMADRGRGYILNVASVAAFFSIPYFAEYAASKAYVVSFSRSLREELKRRGVVVSCLCPGRTSTEFVTHEGRGAAFRGPGVMSAEEVARAGLEGLFKNRALTTPGWRNRLVQTLSRIVPAELVPLLLEPRFRRRL